MLFRGHGPLCLVWFVTAPCLPPQASPICTGGGEGLQEGRGAPATELGADSDSPAALPPPPTYALEIFLLGSSIVAWGNHQDLLYAKTGSHYPGSRVTKPV